MENGIHGVCVMPHVELVSKQEHSASPKMWLEVGSPAVILMEQWTVNSVTPSLYVQMEGPAKGGHAPVHLHITVLSVKMVNFS